MSDYTNYDAAIKAIQDAQQSVNSKYKAIGDASSTLCDINQTIIQVPDASAVRNRGGDVIGYDYKYTTPELPDVGIIGVDSNTDTGTFPEASGGGGSTSGGGAGRYRGSYYAGEVVTDSASSDKAKSTGFVSGLVSSAWAGVSTLAKLGKNVAETASEAIGTFATNFSQTFGSLLTDTADRTGDAIRALFGVDSQGNTSMYLDEDTIGALAIQAKNDGFFSKGVPEPGSAPQVGDSFNDSDLLYMNGYQFCELFGYSYDPTDRNVIKRFPNYGIVGIQGNSPNGVPALFSPSSDGSQTPVYLERTSSGPYTVSKLFLGQAVLDKKVTFHSENYAGPIYRNAAGEIAFGGGGKNLEFTYVTNAISGSGGIGVLLVNVKTNPKTPGISDQSGATSPVDAITGADPHVVAQNLASQYPDVMGTPVQVVVMDDSCNSKTINYYKVPISYSPTNLNISAPITGGLQVSPSFNPNVQLDLPDINMDNYIDQIIKVLGGDGAGRDVTTEPIPSSDPDAPSSAIDSPGVNYEAPSTGTGTTPPTTDPVVAVESMWHIYHALPEQLSALGQWLWSANIIDQIVRTFQNPMEAIMGVHALYVQPPFSTSQVPIVVGNLTSSANGYPLTGQYTALDCGSVWLTEYFGNVFDYDPFTEVSLYLPFVGIVKLDTADVMRAKISVIYGIDCYTGACLAKVSVTRDGAGGVLYEYPGNCAVEYPVSGASYSRMLQSIVGAAMTAVHVGMRTGGAPGSEYLGAAAAGATFLGSGEKISVQRTGSLGGNAGVMGAKIPYLIISRPQPNTAYLFPHYQGIPVNKTVKVSECSGFQRFSSVHLKCPFAYKEELEEIEMLLEKGILI